MKYATLLISLCQTHFISLQKSDNTLSLQRFVFTSLIFDYLIKSALAPNVKTAVFIDILHLPPIEPHSIKTNMKSHDPPSGCLKFPRLSGGVGSQINYPLFINP